MDERLVRREINAGTSTGCFGQFALWTVTILLALGALGRLMSVLLQGLPSALQSYLGATFLFLPGVGVMTVIYFVIRRTRRHFARGLGYSVLVGLALSLGLIAICSSR